MQEKLIGSPLEAIQAALKDLYRRQTNDPKWNPEIDGGRLLELQRQLSQLQEAPLTAAERKALQRQTLAGVTGKANLTSGERAIIVNINRRVLLTRKSSRRGGK